MLNWRPDRFMQKKQKNLIDWDEIRTDLIDGIIALNIRLTNDQVKKLLDYLVLLIICWIRLLSFHICRKQENCWM